MANVTIKRSTATIAALFVMALAVCDVYLLVHSRYQNQVLASFGDKQASTIPKNGSAVPPILGTLMSTGQPYEVYPAGSASLLVLVFRETCKYCEQNWTNWDHLFSSPAVHRVVFVTSDAVVSEDYKNQHPLLRTRPVITGVDSKKMDSLKLGVTPQTIHIVSGAIDQDWVGVLSKNNVNEITKVLLRG